MIKKTLILAGLLCLFFCSCKTYTSTDLPDTQLRFGSGGGFTGMTTEYLLLKNGQLFTRTGRAGSGEWKELEKVDKARAKALYRTWEDRDIFRESVQKPGNMTYFITMKKDSLEYRQSWGAGDYRPDESVKSFYDRAMEIVKDAASAPDTR